MNELRRKDRGIPFEQAKAILEMGDTGFYQPSIEMESPTVYL